MTDQTADGQISSTSMAKGQPGPRPISHVKAVGDFEARIRAAWHKTIEGIVEVATLCVQAQRALSRDELAELKKRIQMSDSTFSKLVAIGRSARIIDSKNWDFLPNSYGTLYELAKLEDAEFESKLEEGAIRKDMQREEAEALNEKWKTSKRMKAKGEVLATVVLKEGRINGPDLDVLEKAIVSIIQCKSFTVETTPAYRRARKKAA